MPEIRYRCTIVVNKCCGGFGLSLRGQLEIARRKSLDVVATDFSGTVYGDATMQLDGFTGFFAKRGEPGPLYSGMPRDDPDLIAVVRDLGQAASGPGADLRVETFDVVVPVEESSGFEQPGRPYYETVAHLQNNA